VRIAWGFTKFLAKSWACFLPTSSVLLAVSNTLPFCVMAFDPTFWVGR
jgi:hypothetical protein